MTAQGIHGTSKFITPPNDPGVVGAAEFYDFAPTPCVCCGCCAPEVVKMRTYAYVMNDKLEMNKPIAPFGICTCSEKCIVDQVSTAYFDRAPHRVGMCCYVIPLTCCGPPVMYTLEPTCCGCCSTESCFGHTLKAAPCNCFGLRTYICCGQLCYESYGVPFLAGLKNPLPFLAKYQQAMEAYKAKHAAAIDSSELAVFEAVKDGVVHDAVVAPGTN